MHFALSAGLILCAVRAAGADPPAAHVELSPHVLADETPRLTLTVSAPKGKGMTVIEPALASTHLAVRITTADGKRIADGLPHVLRRQELPEDYTWLGGGESYTARGLTVFQPPGPGVYRLDVSFRHGAEGSQVTSRAILPLTVRPLDQRAIAYRTAVRLPPDADSVPDDGEVELLVIDVGGEYALYYRISWPGGFVRLVRLWGVSKDARPTTEVIGYDRKSVRGAIRISYVDNSHKVGGEIGYWTGRYKSGPIPAVAPPPRPAKR